MEDDSNQPATKKDLRNAIGELRTELKGDIGELKKDMLGLESRFDTKLDTVVTTLQASMESMRDQIIRAIEMTDETNRKDSVHVDEHTALVQRVVGLEKEVFG